LGTNDFELVKVEKHIKKGMAGTGTKSSNEGREKLASGKEEDMLKGLTFNVHLSSDDLEAKRNLILPYEIVG
jgi:hypothetical protein